MHTPPPADPIAYVDWLLEHMRTNLGYDMKAERVWEFTLRTPDVDTMHTLGRAMRKARYVTAEQESVTESTAIKPTAGKARGKTKWKTVQGPPMVTAFSRGMPNAAGLKRRVRALLALAEKHEAKYESVGSMDLDDFEMMYGPPKAMSLADACWRLRTHTDLGLKPGAKLEYTFCIAAKDAKACTAAIKKAGFKHISKAPQDADWTISVVIAGTNDEKRLKAEFAVMKKATKAADGTLKGVLV